MKLTFEKVSGQDYVWILVENRVSGERRWTRESCDLKHLARSNPSGRRYVAASIRGNRQFLRLSAEQVRRLQASGRLHPHATNLN